MRRITAETGYIPNLNNLLYILTQKLCLILIKNRQRKIIFYIL